MEKNVEFPARDRITVADIHKKMAMYDASVRLFSEVSRLLALSATIPAELLNGHTVH